MSAKHKSRRLERSITMGTTLGVGICVLLWIILSAVVAGLVVNEYIAESSMRWMVPGMQLVISFAGAFAAGKIVTENKGIASSICTAIYFALMAATTLLFFDGKFDNLLFAIIAVIAGGALSILVNLKRNVRSVRSRTIKFKR